MNHPVDRNKIGFESDNIVLQGEVLLQALAEELPLRGAGRPQRLQRRPGRRVLRYPLRQPVGKMRGMVARWLKPDFQIVGIWPFGLEGLWICNDTLQNLIPSFPLDSTPLPLPSTSAKFKERKGSNFAIWQP